MTSRESIRLHLVESADVKRRTAEVCSGDIAAAAAMVAERLGAGSKLLLCGNGGSAADCQHIAAELTSVLSQEFIRPGLPAIALTTDTSFLTASANDFGFEGIFRRLVEALGRDGDVLLAISTSGNSRNVLAAVERAREIGIRTIGLTGFGGGRLAERVDFAIRVPSDRVHHVQEAHIAVGHAICAAVEQQLFSREVE